MERKHHCEGVAPLSEVSSVCLSSTHPFHLPSPPAVRISHHFVAVETSLFVQVEFPMMEERWRVCLKPAEERGAVVGWLFFLLASC